MKHCITCGGDNTVFVGIMHKGVEDSERGTLLCKECKGYFGVGYTPKLAI